MGSHIQKIKVMKNLTLRTKILSGALTTVIILTLICIVSVSLIIYRQNRSAAHQSLQKALVLAERELDLKGDNLKRMTTQIATNSDVISNISVIGSLSFEDGFEGGMKAYYRNLAKALYSGVLTTDIWKSVIYDAQGKPISWVTKDSELITLGFPLTKGIEIAVIKNGGTLQHDSWQKTDSIFKGDYKKSSAPIKGFELRPIDGKLTLVSHTIVKATQYDEDTEKMVLKEIGSLVSMYRLSNSYCNNIKELTGVELNVFNDRRLNIGTLGNMSTLPPNFTAGFGLLSVSNQDYFSGMVKIGRGSAINMQLVALLNAENAMSNTWQVIRYLILATSCCLIIIVPFAFLFSNSVSRPLVNLSEILDKVEQSGEFSHRIEVKSRDEIGLTGAAFNSLMDSLQQATGDINAVMNKIGQGDLSCLVKGQYKGELNKLQTGTNKAIMALNNIVTQAKTVSDSVNTNSIELQHSAETLANGTSRQAASLQEIASSMSEVKRKAIDNNGNASSAKQLVNQALEIVNAGNCRMEEMLHSMHDIQSTSREVTKVISTIDEIAFQTNLLALNAAVEAARAGQYGRGFAVVAEEVRVLANRCADAARTTTELIYNSEKGVENGVVTAGQTADVLTQITDNVSKINILVQETAAASNEQVTSIDEINNGFELINSVVQQNSAISEQTSASSSELSNQANELQKLMIRFRIQQNNAPVTNQISSSINNYPSLQYDGKLHYN